MSKPVEIIQHPLKCEYYPQFPTKDLAARFIEGYKAEGHMKNCSHLSVHRFGNGFSVLYYGPLCAEDSFDRRDDRNSRTSLFYGCPSDCRMFESAAWSKTKAFRKRQWRSFRDSVVGIATWFASLHYGTQIMLTLLMFILVLSLLGIPWRATLADAIKILLSK